MLQISIPIVSLSKSNEDKSLILTFNTLPDDSKTSVFIVMSSIYETGVVYMYTVLCIPAKLKKSKLYWNSEYPGGYL